MSKARKLLTPDVLHQLSELTTMGVPVARAMRQMHLEDITRPTVVMLLKAYEERDDHSQEHYDRTLASLFPPWLVEDGSAIQEQPEEYNYIGFFPQGHWECKI
jgi:hypothetical protein